MNRTNEEVRAFESLRNQFPSYRAERIEGEVASPAEMELMFYIWAIDGHTYIGHYIEIGRILGLYPLPKWYVVSKKLKQRHER